MYTEFYRLSGEPFLLTPDHRFYFESSVHGQAMAHLTYGLNRGEGFIVITGEIGAGKTTLVKHLCASVDEKKINLAHVVTTKLEGFDLLRMVAASFGLTGKSSDNKSTLLLRLQSFFETVLRNNSRAVLIVDEAQNLPVNALEELRMLSNFQVGSVAPFQSFLVGQPQFRSVLASPDLEQLRQRVIATYHLGPMNREECGNYLVHRLQQVGWKEDPSFDTAAVDAIFAHSGGIPRRINTLCNRLMLFGFLDDVHHFTADHVSRVFSDFEAENTYNEGDRRVPRPVNGSRKEFELGKRMDQLENRVSRQETFVKRVAMAMYDFMSLRDAQQ
jgi:putative secretion ATPase (PEP-CTERM system associated)